MRGDEISGVADGVVMVGGCPEDLLLAGKLAARAESNDGALARSHSTQILLCWNSTCCNTTNGVAVQEILSLPAGDWAYR